MFVILFYNFHNTYLRTLIELYVYKLSSMLWLIYYALFEPVEMYALFTFINAWFWVYEPVYAQLYYLMMLCALECLLCL